MRSITFVILILGALLFTGCSNQGKTNDTELMIAAASSLTETLSELKSAFEAEHPETTLTLNYGASGKLSQQIRSGAPVDVFLSADQKWMDRLADKDMIATDTRTDFIQNRLVLISSRGKSIPADQLTDLPNVDVGQIAIGNPESVPAGDYAKQALREAGVWQALQDKLVYTSNAQQTLTYVESGNTDFGIVYNSDLKRSDLVKKILTVDESLHEPIKYPAAVTASSTSKEQAKAFIQFLQTDKAQSILQDSGFIRKTRHSPRL
ncbi:molybdate ABC transporter substrate-binding protein [Lentibacillus salicampi]|uniref:Molybdate ABC transporter substrate-binding protein n=1 Tax=Lentibacillus salicampi TaxID=175306 RepID=A0A4Y9A906_9BACI|nr:molybdate ABC transporter substrate-binding protein [Lentibacillus salicampi]TFJ92273.1 molybdate ABC transporter substrate-binding protein [Lentibacillus salicampi]